MGICSSQRPKSPVPILAQAEPSTLKSEYPFIHKDNIQKHYTLKKVIGTGFFGNVRLAVRFDGVSKEKFAVKSLTKEKITNKSLLKRELETFRQLNHPNIVQLYEVFEDERYMHLVMQHCSGGELFERITGDIKFSEKTAAETIQKLLHAIAYMHNLKISHRDIKAENIMYSSPEPDSEVKLIDFGLSTKFGDDNEMNSIVGTSYYIAPEVLRKKYGPECDVWSLGVLTYFMLSGKLPFDGESRKDIYIKILSEEVKFDDPVWEQISDTAKDLIRRMLEKSPQNRILAKEAIKHPWFNFKSISKAPQKYTSRVMKRLHRSNHANGLRKDILNVIALHLNTDELKQLNDIFRDMDSEQQGYISCEQFEAALENMASTETLQEIYQNIGHAGKIDYSAFITAAMDRRILNDRETRWMTFKFFDAEDQGYITIESIQTALERMDIQAGPEEIQAMIQEAGLKYEHWIDFTEFCKILDPLPDELSSVSGAGSLAELPPLP